ncbi:MAG TPA: O-antigen ligase family protein, partial [Gemmatimonadales bacterium]|nr:O-antigen ligase family protein [Gemmatimonadales bacterium]
EPVNSQVGGPSSMPRSPGTGTALASGFAFSAALYSDVILGAIGVNAPEGAAAGILVALAGLAGVIVLALRGPRAALERVLPTWPIVTFLAWCALTLAWSPDPSYGWEKLFFAVAKVSAFGVLVLGALGPGRSYDLRPVLWCGLAAALLVILAGAPSFDYPGRWTFGAMNPIWTGRIGWTLCLAAMVVPGGRIPARSIFLLAGGAVGMMSASRGPAIAFLVALGLWWLFLNDGLSRARNRVLARALRAGGCVLGLIAVLLIGAGEAPTENRIVAFEEIGMDANVLARLDLQRSALTEFARQPVLGTGLGGLAVGNSQRYPHNILIEIVAETGVVGLLLVLWAGVLVWRRAGGREDLAALWLYLLLCATSSGDLSGNWLLWLLAGVLLVRPVETRLVRAP